MRPEEAKIKESLADIAAGLASKRLLGQIHPPPAAVLRAE
jgi:hypothetical protein